MTEWQDNVDDPQPKAGLVATFFVFVIILFFTGLVLTQAGQEAQVARAEPLPATPLQASAGVLATVSLTDTPVPQPSPTLKPTVTATFTPTPTDTPTPTASPTPSPTPTNTFTPTPTALPTNPANNFRPLPPTMTPTPLPLPTPTAGFSRTMKVPILMYHYISMPPAEADKYRTDLSVSPEDFRAQMQYLAANGYTPIDLYDLSLAVTNQSELPEKPIVITIDDGYRDNYEIGFPILQAFGFKATIFLVTNFIDANHPGYLTWAMVHEMAAAGFRFEPHSKSHWDLREQSRDFLIWEILGSQETIAAHVGYTPKFFAYPSGRYDEDTTAVVDELEFWGAVTTQGGTWHGFKDRFEWRRVRIHNYTTMEDFAELVDLGATRHGQFPR